MQLFYTTYGITVKASLSSRMKPSDMLMKEREVALVDFIEHSKAKSPSNTSASIEQWYEYNSIVDNVLPRKYGLIIGLHDGGDEIFSGRKQVLSEIRKFVLSKGLLSVFDLVSLVHKNEVGKKTIDPCIESLLKQHTNEISI